MPRPKKYKTKVKFKLKPESARSIFGLAAFAAAGITILAFAGQASGAGNTLQTWLNHAVGWASFMVPILLISTGLTFSRINLGIARANVWLGLLIFTVALATLLHPVSSLFSELSALQRAEAGLGGGAVGYALFNGTAEFITPMGAWFIFSLILVAGILIAFNTSLNSILETSSNVAEGGKNAVEKAKGLTSKKDKDNGKPSFEINEMGMKPTAATAANIAPAAPINSTKILANEAGDNIIWEYPPLNLLSSQSTKGEANDAKGTAATIEKTLDSFGIQANVVKVNVGPTVTQYALNLSQGTKIAKVTTLANDLALAVAARGGAVRVEAPIPGQSLVGIEVPNAKQALVGLRSILESDEAKQIKSRLILPLGQSVSGDAILADLTKMPHLLVAGSTGSGKSIAINTFISSLLYHNSPSELKLILVDPKFVELTGYNGIPHLLAPVITESEKVVSALKWATSEMDKRYQRLASVGARNIEAFNEKAGYQELPYIVIIIDELSDLMMTAPAEVEDAIVRIAQKARAVGIHLILATQRPSSDIITGLIKANIPARIAFNVSSNVDSRVILDSPGAEKLLGKGDMLFMPPDASKPLRIQGSMVSDPEINKMLDFIKNQGITPEYSDEVLTMPINGTSVGGGISSGGGGGDRDPMFMQAVQVVAQNNTGSASLLQRRLKLGYARAARVLDELESAGVVGPADGSKPREVNLSAANQLLGGTVPDDSIG